MEVRASHILVGTEEMAKDILKKIEAGGDFAGIARASSKCPSKEKGGDLGYFTRGRMVPEFDRFCFSHQKGETGIVKTQFGWHVIRVTDLRK